MPKKMAKSSFKSRNFRKYALFGIFCTLVDMQKQKILPGPLNLSGQANKSG